MVFEMLVLDLFACDCLVEGFFTIFKGTAYVNDYDLIVIDDYNIWSNWGIAVLNCLVCGDGSRTDGVGEVVNYFIVAFRDSRHVGWTMREDMREGFVSPAEHHERWRKMHQYTH